MILGLAMVLVVAGLGLPFVNGILAEKGFRALVADLNEMNTDQGTGMTAEIVEYRRGLWNSEAVWKIDLGPLETVYGIEEIVFDNQARHGYTGVVVTTSLGRNPWYRQSIDRQLAGRDPLALTSTFHLGGSIQIDVALAPVSLHIDEHRVISQSADLLVETDWNLARVTASGTWQGLRIDDELAMEGLAFNSDLRPISSFIWDGGMSVHIGKLSGRDGQNQVVIDGLRGSYTLKYLREKKTLNLEETYGVGLFSTTGLQMENGSVTFGVRNLDARAYEEAIKISTGFLGVLFKELDAAGGDPEKIQTVVERQLNNATLQLLGLAERSLTAGLEIFVSDLHAGLAQGQVQGNMLLRLDKGLTMARMLPLLHRPEQIFAYIDLSGALRVPAGIVGERSGMLLTPLAPGRTTGFFVQDGTDLVNTTVTREHRLYINDEQLVFN
ncbi:MAG: DUF945 family protein [Desulfopila sp.]